jgi:hypothetical protein
MDIRIRVWFYLGVKWTYSNLVFLYSVLDLYSTKP